MEAELATDLDKQRQRREAFNADLAAVRKFQWQTLYIPVVWGLAYCAWAWLKGVEFTKNEGALAGLVGFVGYFLFLEIRAARADLMLDRVARKHGREIE
jgi:hypothetical protein